MKGCTVCLWQLSLQPKQSKEGKELFYDTSTHLDELHTKDSHHNSTSGVHAIAWFLEQNAASWRPGVDAPVGGYRNMAVAVTITVTHSSRRFCSLQSRQITNYSIRLFGKNFPCSINTQGDVCSSNTAGKCVNRTVILPPPKSDDPLPGDADWIPAGDGDTISVFTSPFF